MDQVSRPVLIALAATVALLAVWLVALRPKPVAVKDTPLAPTKAIPAARQASAASDAANAKLQAASRTAGGQSAAAASAASAKASPAAGTSTKPSAAGAVARSAAKSATPGAISRAGSKREQVVQREIRHGKVVVMLFWSAGGADDVATHGAIRSLDRHHGKVKVHVIPISHVGDYGSITRQISIAQSPTPLIIGRNGRARTIVGLTEPKELGQAVTDAIARR